MTAKRQANKTNKPEYESDLPINEDYLSSSEKKAWKKNSGLYGFFFFFFFFFQAHYCKDFFHIHIFIRSSNIWLSYSQPFKTNKVEKVDKYTKNTQNKLLFTYRTIGNI